MATLTSKDQLGAQLGDIWQHREVIRIFSDGNYAFSSPIAVDAGFTDSVQVINGVSVGSSGDGYTVYGQITLAGSTKHDLRVHVAQSLAIGSESDATSSSGGILTIKNSSGAVVATRDFGSFRSPRSAGFRGGDIAAVEQTITLNEPPGTYDIEFETENPKGLSGHREPNTTDLTFRIRSYTADVLSGRSAYDEWILAGNTGTETDFLNSLTGPAGTTGLTGNTGADGPSAYDVAVADGFVGTEAQWLASLESKKSPLTVGTLGYWRGTASLASVNTEAAITETSSAGVGFELSGNVLTIKQGYVATISGHIGQAPNAAYSDFRFTVDGVNDSGGNAGGGSNWSGSGSATITVDATLSDKSVRVQSITAQSGWTLKINVTISGGVVDVNSLNGPAGDSAYQVAVNGGFVGTEAQWLASLVGSQGIQGIAGANGTDGTNGVDGDSAYQVAVANGFVGTESQWLASLVGAQGTAGTNGTNGVDGTNGTDGTNGESAYQVAVNGGFVGTEAQWLASLVGAQGTQGAPGPSSITFQITDDSTVATDQTKVGSFYVPANLSSLNIVSISLNAASSPTGNCNVTLSKNSAPVHTITLTGGTTTTSPETVNIPIASGDRLIAKVSSMGTTGPKGLVVTVELS